MIANPQAAALYGYGSGKELIGKYSFDLIAPEDRQRANDNMPKSLKTGTVGEFDYILLRKDGNRFLGELRAGAILDENGEPKALISVVRGISGRTR